ncbi:peptidoglycan-binding protein, partial [bacterium]|nr:peptidoglycan-binding protein [bacterium]
SFHCENTGSCASSDFKIRTDWRPEPQNPTGSGGWFVPPSAPLPIVKIVKEKEKKILPLSPVATSGIAFWSIDPRRIATSWTFGKRGEGRDMAPEKKGFATLRITRPLYRGMRHAEVAKLQKMLAAMPGMYPEGLVTGYFGALTRKAVERFQVAHGIVGPGGRGYGFVGPKTRKKLNE